jgi:hypothetical protein
MLGVPATKIATITGTFGSKAITQSGQIGEIRLE